MFSPVLMMALAIDTYMHVVWQHLLQVFSYKLFVQFAEIMIIMPLSLLKNTSSQLSVTHKNN